MTYILLSLLAFAVLSGLALASGGGSDYRCLDADRID